MFYTCACQGFCLGIGLHKPEKVPPVQWGGEVSWPVNKPLSQEWHRFKPDAAWLQPHSRPGESPFKTYPGNQFAQVPGGDAAARVKPDLVHTFHIGIGADLCASMIIWLCLMGKFGSWRALDQRIREAYTGFRAWCYDENRYTSCDEWCVKQLGMSSTLGNIPLHSTAVACLCLPLRAADFPTSLNGKGHDTAVVCKWLQAVLLEMAPLLRKVCACALRNPRKSIDSSFDPGVY